MIYIITPHMGDAREQCNKLGLPFNQGRSRNDVIWVNDICKILGRCIFPDDQVIWGDKYYFFDLEHLNRIEQEIKLRQFYGKNTKRKEINK